jgi:small ligand-binding sensory domain FIST
VSRHHTSGTAACRAALSLHPLAAAATGEVVAEALDAVGHQPDLAIVVATGTHRGSLGAIVDAVRELLAPTVTVYCGASAVVAGSSTSGDGDGVLLWVGRTGPVTAVQPRAGAGEPAVGADATTFSGLSDDLPHHGTLLVVGTDDPTTTALLDELAQHRPGLHVVGGLFATGARLGVSPPVGHTETTGNAPAIATPAVVVLNDTTTRSVASHDFRSVGQPMAVTAADDCLVLELAGRPALDMVDDLIAELDAGERMLAADGLHLGRVVDSRATDYTAADFVVTPVRGVVTARRAVAASEPVEVGSVVQFHLHDPGIADTWPLPPPGSAASDGAVLFITAAGADAAAVGERLDMVAPTTTTGTTAGIVCAAGIAPVGQRSWRRTVGVSGMTFTAPD